MLALSGKSRFLLYQHPVSMHKSFEGLSGAIEQIFPEELYSGAYFIFLNKHKTHMKVLFWDNDGWVIYFKRLEKGTFSMVSEGATWLDRRAFFMLLEGVVPKRLQARFSL